MPPSGWKRNAEGTHVPPDDPTHPDHAREGSAPSRPEPVGRSAPVAPVDPDAGPKIVSPEPLPAEPMSVPDAIEGEQDHRRRGAIEEVNDYLTEAYEPLAPREKYWVGLTPDAPTDYVTVGGIAISKFTFHPTSSSSPGGSRSKPPYARGGIAFLDEDQMATLLVDLKRWMVRFVGNPQATGYLRRLVDMKRRDDQYRRDPVSGKTVKKGGFRLQRGDHPIGCYAYIVPWELRLDYMRSDEFPPRVLKFPESVIPMVEGVCGNLVRKLAEIEDPANPTNTRVVVPVPGMGAGTNVHSALHQIAKDGIPVE